MSVTPETTLITFHTTSMQELDLLETQRGVIDSLSAGFPHAETGSTDGFDSDSHARCCRRCRFRLLLNKLAVLQWTQVRRIRKLSPCG
jgi:phage head maturation protease